MVMEGKAKQGGRKGNDMNWVSQFEGQMLVCGFLAKALYGTPDREWLNSLVQSGVFQEVPFGGELPEVKSAIECFGRWIEDIGGEIGDEEFVRIRDDYTQLFIGPGKLPAAPWESVYTNKDRAVFQMETVSVKNWYMRFDLALATEYNEPADHIGLQFGFLSHLSGLTIAASEISDGAEVKRLIDAQRGFLAQHILKWVPRWADDVVANARTDLYRGLAWLVRGVAIEAGSFFSVVSQQAPQVGSFRIAEGPKS